MSDDRMIEEKYSEPMFAGTEGWPAYLGDPPFYPCAFQLERREDVSGVSGTGIVAEGIAFSDGSVALRWLSDWPTSVVFHERGIGSVHAVHGHDGRTRIVWL